jgi:hypothetical protein
VPVDGWISQREATFMLQCGVRITERQARRVLAAGLAGAPQRVPGMHLYDRERVSALLATTQITESELDARCPHGLFVARRTENLGSGWRFSWWTCVWLRVRIERHGPFPLLATVGGFVVAAADILDATTAGTLLLADAGTWSATLVRRRLVTGPGRDWWIRGLDRPRQNGRAAL